MAKNQSNDSEPKVLLDEEAILDDIVASPYKYGFTTDLETEEFEKGLSQEIVEKISLGKLQKFKQENSLMSQIWVMDTKKKVSDIINELNFPALKVKDFFRLKIGD